MPWFHADGGDIGSLYYYLERGEVCGTASRYNAGLAFVEWSRGDTFDLMLRIEQVACYEHSYTSPRMIVDPDFRSAVCNCNVTYEAGVFNSQPELWAPVWAVTPVDNHYFWQWSCEAEELWAAREWREVPEEIFAQDEEWAEQEHLGNWLCCGDTPHHVGEGHFADAMRSGVAICKAIQYELCSCTHEYDCDDIGCECSKDALYCIEGYRLTDIIEEECTCGLTAARRGLHTYLYGTENLGLSSCTYQLADLVTTDVDVYIPTINYAYESFYRGWQRCADLVKAEEASAGGPDYEPNNLEHNWFSSFWQRSAPFWDLSGPAQQAAIQLPFSTSSATRLAS